MTRVLYVEDDPVNRLVLEKYLGDVYRVDLARNCEEAQRLVYHYRYPVLLLDINLGVTEMTGIELLKHLRKSYPDYDPKSIAVTAFTDLKNDELLQEAGFHDFHAKPIDRFELIRQINGLIS
jgi:CheY-like chemotaxis protein